MQTIITEAVLDRYGTEHWRIGKQSEIDSIVKWTEQNTPPDLLEAVEQAKRKLGIIDEIVLEEG